MAVRAVARNVTVSPKKIRRVLSTVRGEKVERALELLGFLPTPAAREVAKVVKSAATTLRTTISCRRGPQDSVHTRRPGRHSAPIPSQVQGQGQPHCQAHKPRDGRGRRGGGLMGQKTHPVGFRLGIIKDWQAKWYAARPSQYRDLLQEDLKIRSAIMSRLPEAGISRVELERGPQELVVTIHSARPGIVIGRGGQRVEGVRRAVEGLSHKRARLNVQEVRQPELDAQLVAMSIAEQLGRRIAFRRAMHPGGHACHAGRSARHQGHLQRPAGRR